MMQPAPLPCGCPALGSARRAVDRYVVRRSVGSSVCSQGVHAHGEPRIVLTLRGSFTTRYRVATLRADPAHAVFRTGADEHRDVYERDALCLSIALPPDERNVAVRAPFVVAGPSFWHIARHISTEIAHTDQISDLVLSGLFAEVTALVLNSEPHESGSPRWLCQVRDWLDDTYLEVPTLERIGAAIGRNPSHVAVAFKRRYGKTMGAYVRDVRMGHGLRLLADRRIPLAEVAQRIGFADQSHFTRHFRRRFSMSPGVYRRRFAIPRQLVRGA